MSEWLSYNLTNVKIYDDAFDFAFNSPLGNPVGRYMERRGRAALAYSKTRVGVRTGALKAALSMAHDRGAKRQQQIRIGTLKQPAGKGYSYHHHQGSGPHIIKGKRGRLMTFTVSGRRVTTSLVHHPGAKPNNYLTDTFKMFVG